MTCYEPSHLDLHCLQRYLYVGMKGLKVKLTYMAKLQKRCGIQVIFFLFLHKNRLWVLIRSALARHL